MTLETYRENFYPRPPRGGRHYHEWYGRIKDAISIHALREEGDFYLNFCRFCFFSISIHALREEGDSKNRDKISIFL